MTVKYYKMLLLVSLAAGCSSLIFIYNVKAKMLAQIPTVSLPTVTGSPLGPMATVRRDINLDQINVRAGPNASNYDIIGILIAGQSVPALGRTSGGLWIEISYPGVPGGVGWVYAPYVEVTGDLPIVIPPPTSTPQTTPTIDPTLAAQFVVDIPPTRLPTFTPPPPIVIPTFQVETSPGSSAGVPMGLIIVGLGVIGLFGTFISFLRQR
jgi:hypothetical protein